MPSPVRALAASSGTPLEPVGVQQPSDVVEHRLSPVVGHLVDVVEHDHHHRPVRGHRCEVAVVDRGVGVLLRVQHPHHQVGELDQPVDLEMVGHLGGVVVGQVEQDDALERLVLLAEVEQGVAHGLVARRDAEVVEQLLGALLAPHARGRPRRRGTAYADRGELDPRERVERRGLARSGGAGDRHDRVVGGRGRAARRRAPMAASRIVDHGVVEASASGLAGSPESLDPVTQIRASRHEPLGPVQQGRSSSPSRRTRNRSQPSLVGPLIRSRDHAPGPRDEPLDER